VTPDEVEAGLRLLARLVARMVWTHCGEWGCQRTATKRNPNLATVDLATCDEHAPAHFVDVPHAEDMRALSALAFPPEPGTLTRAEADELGRQGDG